MLEYDLIEIHHNPNIKNKPYLVRVYNYNNNDPTEIRLEEIDNLFSVLKEYKVL